MASRTIFRGRRFVSNYQTFRSQVMPILCRGLRSTIRNEFDTRNEGEKEEHGAKAGIDPTLRFTNSYSIEDQALELRKRDQLCEIGRAFNVLASAPSLSSERVEFIRLVNKEIEYYNSMINKGAYGEKDFSGERNRQVEKVELLETPSFNYVELIRDPTVVLGESKLDLQPKGRKEDFINRSKGYYFFDRVSQIFFNILATMWVGPKKAVDSLLSKQDPIPSTNKHFKAIKDELAQQSRMLRELMDRTS